MWQGLARTVHMIGHVGLRDIQQRVETTPGAQMHVHTPAGTA